MAYTHTREMQEALLPRFIELLSNKDNYWIDIKSQLEHEFAITLQTYKGLIENRAPHRIRKPREK